MTTLVTGATGFVGSQVVDALLAGGETVRALVRDPARAAGLKARGVDVRMGDVRDPAAVQTAVRGAEIVHHCAAAVGPHLSKGEIYSTNLGGVENMLKGLCRQGTGRLVLLSSINVLGMRNLDPATEALPRRRSNDPAADVKIDAELRALDYQRRGVHVTILRPGFIYGSGDRHNVPTLARAIQRGRFAYVGSRDNVVPIVHVSDVVEAMLLAAAAPAASGRVYHVSDGSRTTIGQFVGRLAELLGCSPPEKVLPYFVPYVGCMLFELLAALRLREGPAPISRPALRFLGTSRFVDIERARQELGYSPRVGYREGLADAAGRLGGQSHEQRSAAVSSA